MLETHVLKQSLGGHSALLIRSLSSLPSFMVAERFTTKNSVVKILSISSEFARLFGAKIEQEVKNNIIAYSHLLTIPIGDMAIFSRIDGANKAVLSLSSIYSLLTKQNNCQEGSLITTGEANVFYAVDVFNVVQAVSLHATDNGWKIFAHQTEDFEPWKEGCQIFTAKPWPESSRISSREMMYS